MQLQVSELFDHFVATIHKVCVSLRPVLSTYDVAILSFENAKT